MKINNCFELIEYDDIKEIKKLYKNYIIDNILLLIMKIVIVQMKVIMKKKPEEYSDSESSSSEEKEVNDYYRDSHWNNDESDNDENIFKINKRENRIVDKKIKV